MLVVMNRIDTIFKQARAERQTLVMPFITAGYPDLTTTATLLNTLQHAGAGICELGIAFSDPIADGPIIAASMTAALDHGVTVDQVLQTVAEQRENLNMGLVAMVSYSIVHRRGLETFVDQAKQAGFDGFIFPDLSYEESQPAVEVCADRGMSLSMLIAPSTPIERAKQIAQQCTGFVYVLARAGITGERAELPEDLAHRLAALRSVTDLPLAVGFGISQPTHIKQLAKVADAAIVGSAIVRRISTLIESEQPDQIATEIHDFVHALSDAGREAD